MGREEYLKVEAEVEAEAGAEAGAEDHQESASGGH